MSATRQPAVQLMPMEAGEAATWLAGSIRRYAAAAAEASSLDLAAARARGEQVVGEVLPQGPATPGHGFCRVAVGGETVGSVWYGPPGDGANELYLWDVLIEPDHRGRGLGRLVLEAMRSEAQRRGARCVRLNVFATNTGARRLYERSGFRVDTEQDGYISMVAEVHTFTTPRLDVRPWQLDEAGILLDIRRRPEVARWMSDRRAWEDIEVARDHIAGWAARRAAGDVLGTWAIVPRELGTPVGSVLLDRLGDGDEVECGWYLHPDRSGRGYASEAARGVLAYAWRLGYARVHAIMWPGNEPSERVCRAIGMRDLGEVPDPWYGTDEEPTSPMWIAERPEHG